MPRPRFTLRVALALTAIVAVLAWQGSIVWQRKAAMSGSEHTFILNRYVPGQPAGHRPTVNALRALLGDEPVQTIYLAPGKISESERDRLQRIFPEAHIEVGRPLVDLSSQTAS
jgi:hypothetical protein